MRVGGKAVKKSIHMKNLKPVNSIHNLIKYLVSNPGGAPQPSLIENGVVMFGLFLLAIKPTILPSMQRFVLLLSTKKHVSSRNKKQAWRMPYTNPTSNAKSASKKQAT
jgi:hypothetical protein